MHRDTPSLQHLWQDTAYPRGFIVLEALDSCDNLIYRDSEIGRGCGVQWKTGGRGVTSTSGAMCEVSTWQATATWDVWQIAAHRLRVHCWMVSACQSSVHSYLRQSAMHSEAVCSCLPGISCCSCLPGCHLGLLSCLRALYAGCVLPLGMEYSSVAPLRARTCSVNCWLQATLHSHAHEGATLHV